MPRVCLELDCDGNGNGGPVVSTYATTVGNGTETEFVLDHNLGYRDVFVQAYDLASGNDLTPDVDVVRVNDNRAVLRFATAPASMSARVAALAVRPAA